MALTRLLVASLLPAAMLAGTPKAALGNGTSPPPAAGSFAEPCACRNRGVRVPIGGVACLETPAGPRRARCVMQQNSPSWSIGAESCPVA